MRKFRLPLAILLTALLLIYPTAAANAAREALWSWATAVAPSILPFLLLLPLLTAEESLRACEKFLSPLMRLLCLPAAAAPAVALSMVAGTPTGAAAARRIADSGAIAPETQSRITCCCAGVSPMFLLSSLFDRGEILLRAQILTQLTLLLLTARKKSYNYIDAKPARHPDADPTWTAIRTALTVAANMAAFSVLTVLIGKIFRSETVETAAAILLDLPTAARKIMTAFLPETEKTLLTAFAVGLCGACIAAQNVSAAGKNLKIAHYIRARLAAALLMTAFAWFQMNLPATNFALSPKKILALSAIFSAIFTLPMWLGIRNTLYLNKRNLAEKAENRHENHNI